MKKILFSMFAISTLAFATCPKSCKSGCTSYEIVTGGKGKTYYAFGKDLASYVAPDACIDLKVVSTNGSIENIRKLKSSKQPKVKLAIVQSDVLQYYKKQLNSKNPLDRKEAKDILSKIRVIAPLYKEELHFVVRADSNLVTFSDLKDKRISIGKPNSGNAMTAFILYKELFNEDLKDKNIEIQDFYSGLSYLGDKKVDAVLLVAGQPVSKLINNNSDASNIIKLLEYTEKDNDVKSYYISTIKKSSYPWLKEDMQTLSVKSYLVTYNYKKFTKRKLFDFVKSLKQKLPYLKKVASLDKNTPHPKWKEVDNLCTLESLPGGWKYYSVVENICNGKEETLEHGTKKCNKFRQAFDPSCQK